MLFLFSRVGLLALSGLSLLQLVSAQCPPKSKSLPDLLYLGVPNNCIRGSSGSKCDIFLRMAPNEENSTFIDFYLEGNLPGWVAVGFSENKDMALTDVLGCKRFKNDSLSVINGWNPDVQPRRNVRDPSQNLMCPHSISYDDKRISCHFSRYSGVINEGYDFDLDGVYYLILGHSSSQDTSDHLPIHTVTPVISSDQYDLYNFTGNGSTDSAEFKMKMKKAHGAFMIISWLMFAGTGIFFAMWMKPVLVDGLWFQFHRVFMVISVVLELVGFICIFIGMKDNETPGLLGFECPIEIVHFTFGILVTIGMLTNPIVGLLRCKTDSPRRWIFNLTHGLVGSGSWIIALINITLGLILFQHPCGSDGKYYIVKVYAGWLGFLVLSHLVMFLTFTCLALSSTGTERYQLAPSVVKYVLKYMDDPAEYASLNTNTSNENNYVVGKDSTLRKIAFGIYTGVNFIVVIILVGLIGDH